MSHFVFEKLVNNIKDNQFSFDTKHQLQCLHKIKAGGDFICVTADLISISQAIIAAFIEKEQTPADDDAPRFLIMAPEKETALLIEEIWMKLSRRTEIIHTVTHEKGDKVKQRNALFQGADVVIGTPKRMNELYFQNGININKLKYFLMIDADKCVRASSIGYISRMIESFPKCQKMVISKVMEKNTEKISELILSNPFVFQ